MPTSNPNTLNMPLKILVLVIATSLPFKNAWAAELLFFHDAHCGACLSFEKDVGGIYHKTQEAILAPLQRVEFYSEDGKISDTTNMPGLTTPVAWIPSFVVMDNGREIGRIAGYQSAELFWMALNQILEQLPKKPETPDPAQ